jgi:phage shock protein PspC (stress-responsive transcriptional regulator)
MFCTRCGIEIRELDFFCSSCGQETPRAAEARRRDTSAYAAPRRLYRCTSDKMIGGVCSGLSRYMNVDVTLVRLAVVLGVIFSGGLVLLGYIAAWIIMPSDYYAPPLRSPVNTASQSTS